MAARGPRFRAGTSVPLPRSIAWQVPRWLRDAPLNLSFDGDVV
jgi:hypothetical protein